MKYIINFTITFDPDSRLLKLRNKDQLTIELSKPATRLLIELIKNNKNEMTRETLIKHVWEDYGFSPSSATLSNHISELRKAFEALGINKDILFFFGYHVVQLPEVITLQAGRCIFTILSLYVWHRNNGSFTNLWDRPLLRKK